MPQSTTKNQSEQRKIFRNWMESPAQDQAEAIHSGFPIKLALLFNSIERTEQEKTCRGSNLKYVATKKYQNYDHHKNMNKLTIC